MANIIQHIFTYTGEDGYEFCDALVMPEEEFNALSEQEIEDLKKARYDAWQEVIHTTDPNIITDAVDAEQPVQDEEVLL